jgi:hypothetical protein
MIVCARHIFVQQFVTVLSFFLYIMKVFFFTLLIVSIIPLAGCNSQKALTEAEQAAQFNMTVEEYRLEKQAAARMNMNFDEHIKMRKNEGIPQ